MSKHTPGPIHVTKCRCGHPSCNQYTLSTQRSVGFLLADAILYSEAPAMLDALRNLDAELSSDGDFENRERCKAEMRAILARIDDNN